MALVSSYERLKETAEIAANSQNAAQLQYLKTLDSIEAKQQQLQTSMQSLYTSTGIQNFYKTLIDLGNSVVQSFTDIPTILNLPLPALLKFGTTFYNIATLVTQMYSMLRARMNVQTKVYENAITANLALEAAKRKNIRQEEYQAEIKAAQSAQEQVEQLERNKTNFLKEQATLRQKIQGFFTNKKNIGMVASAVGMAATLGATTMSADTAGQRAGKGALTGLGGLAQGVGTGLMIGGPAGAIMGVLTALPAAIEAIGIAIETTEEKIERYDKAIQDANNNKLISENELNTLTDYRKKFEDLEKHQHDSNQARQEFLTLNAEIAANYPELINGIDEQGNLIVKLGTAYQQLINKKKNAYDDSFIEYWKKQFEAFSDSDFISSRIGVGLNTIANTQLGNTAEKIKEDVTAQAVANGNIIESQRTQLDIIRSLAQESKEIDDEYSISKEGYEQLKAKLVQYINFNSEQLDNALGALENEAGTQVTFSGTQLAKKLDAAMDSYLTLNSQATLEDWVTEWNLNKSENTQQITSAVTEVKEYEETLYNNLITSMVSDVRKMYDSIFDPQDTLNELSGSFINNTLIDSAKAAIAGAADPSQAFNDWAKTVLPELYTSLLKNIQDNNSDFSTLNKYYTNVGEISTDQHAKLESQYGTMEAWKTIEDKYQQLQAEANKALAQAGINGFTNFSANMKNRIAALKDKDNFDVQAFVTRFSTYSEEQIGQLLGFIESGATDTITGLETIIKQYAEANNIDLSNYKSGDRFIELMRDLQRTVSINFNTEYQMLADGYNAHLKELDKALKGATSGMDNQDATKLAAQLNTSLSDENFKFLDGKWYYQNLQKIYDAFMPDDGLLTTLNTFIEEGSQYQNAAIGAIPEQYRKLIQDFKKSGKIWEEYTAALKGNIDGLEKARTIMQASGFLAIGDIDNFIKTLGATDNITGREDLYQAVLSGKLEGSYAQFTEELLKYYQAGVQEVYDAAVKLLSKEGTTANVKVTEGNQKLIKDITGKEYAIDAVATLNIEQVASSWDKLLANLAENKALTFKQKVDQMAKFHNAGFEGNTYDAITSVIKSFEEFDISQALMLPQSLQKFVEMNKVTGKYFINLNDAAETLNDTYLKGLGWDNKQINGLQATIRKSQRENDIKTIASDIVKNRESLTEENISSIATALGQTYDEVIATLQLQRNQDGTYRMNMNSILQLMNQKKGQLDTVLAQMIAEEIDNIIGNVSNIASNQGKGITSYVEMQKATSRAQQAGFDVDISELYEWNDTIHGFVLSANGILVEVARAQMEFESLTDENKEARQLLQEQIKSMGQQLANSIDINAFMQAENKNPGSEAAKTLTKGIDDYNSYLRAIGQTTLLDADKLIQNLRHGGQEAVSALTAVARLQGRELNKQEIETAYRASVERLLAIGQELTASAGEIISKDTAQKLQKHTQAKLKNLGNGSYLVLQAAENLTLAYLNLYSELARSGQATLAELNNTAAQYYNSREGAKKGQLLDMLSNSAEMTYNQLAEMFTAAGWKFTTDTIDQLGNNISKLNNGRVRINNFKGFADALGINTNSPEYLEAFKSYNDALIKESQFVEKTINDELNNLVKAKPGDLINISGLYTKVGEMLEVELMTVGVQFNDGIVKITEATNLPALIQSIESAAAAQGLILESDVQALIDAVQSLFKGLADSITKGIQGTLSNTEAMDLQSSVRNLIPGFKGDLKFTQTYNGLKLSTDQAIKLYDAMKSVDTVSAHIVFDSLTKQLTKAGEACESMSRAMAEIARLEDKVKQSTGDARKEAEKQLAVYKQIANTQIQNPESYDWMNRDLPDYLKGPENYWNSLGTAFKALNQAAKEAEEGSTKAAHMLDPTDFYNMVNQFNNIAQLSGTEINFLGHKLNGDMTSAAKLIEEGMRTLSNVDGNGVKVDLTKFGANFVGGAEGMAKGVHEGIKAMAESQIEMLDGMIQLLETVVAMEGLKDIAGTDNKIDLTDLFPKFTVEGQKHAANQNTRIFAAQILKQAETNEDLKKGLNGLIMDGQSIGQLLEQFANGTEFTQEQAQIATKKLEFFNKMLQSNDYSQENIITSIRQAFGSTGYNGTITLPNKQTYYIAQDFVLEQGENGWEVPGVGSFEDENQALKAYMLKEKTGATNISFTKEGQAFSTIDIGGQEVRVETTINGVEYNVNRKNCNSYNQAAQYAYKQYVKQFRISNSADAIPLSEEQWRIQLNVPLESSVNITNETQVKTAVQNATHEQIVALSKALASGNAEQIETAVIPFKIDYKAEGQTSALQSDIDKIANLAGIDTKTMALSLATEIVSDNDNVKKIFSNEHLSATVDLTGNLTNLDGTQNTLTYDEQVSVTLANIKAMATAESINWDGITALINTVPEDKRPTVEAQAKQYIIKALEGNPEYQGFPTLLTGLQGLPIPALQATATVMSILWGGGANVTNATGLTQDQINALAATLDLPDTMLEALATLVQITDGGVVPEESAELATKLSQIFQDGKYTPNDIKAITLAATAAAVMINGKGVIATGEFDDSYKTTNGIAQVTADIIKLIVSTNASTTTEEGTTFNADNWQGTVDKIYAVAALLEVGLQNGADVNVDGTNIPSNVATTKTIEALRASAAVLSVIFQKDPTGKNINVEEVDRVIAELVDQGKIQASDIKDIKAIVNKILFTPKDANLTPQGLDTLIPKDTDGAYNAGKLTVKYQTEVEFTDSAEEAYKALRDQLYTLSQGTNAGLYETWGNKSFVNPQTGVTTFLDQLLDKVVNKGHILTRAEQNILNNYKTAIEAAPEELANNFKSINMTIDALIDENDLNISNQQEQFSILSQTFSQLDPTNLQTCATAMSELAESAQKVKDVPWQELVNGVNNINNIETPNEDLATASTIMRTIQASLSVVAATGDTIASFIVNNQPIVQDLILHATIDNLSQLIDSLKNLTISLDNNDVREYNKISDIKEEQQQKVEYNGSIKNLTTDLKSVSKTIDNTSTSVDKINNAYEGVPTQTASSVNEINDNLQELGITSTRSSDDLTTALSQATRGVNIFKASLDRLPDNKVIDIVINASIQGEAGVTGTIDGQFVGRGNIATIALSESKGRAMAAGHKTLVGELGPELVVANGRYYVVGQGGAQMVSLPDDAIVFNHIQTQNILKKQRNGGRGKPITNERNAVAFAKGTGPAMASASSALAALKQIRAMWQSMLNASMKDLGSLAGQEVGTVSGNKGSGSNSGANDLQQMKAILAEIERWYNLLRQISTLQKEITYQETLQAEIASNRVANGKALYSSYKRQIEYLDQQIIKNQQLADLQKSWFERKRNELAESDYGKIFTYDQNGQLQYRHGENLGLDVLEKLTSRNIYGQTTGAAMNAQTQLQYLKSIGFNIDKLKYNDDGTVIDLRSLQDQDEFNQAYENMMNNFWDNLDGWKDELDGIYDSYHEQLTSVLSNQDKRNALLQKIIDNQLSVEQDVLHAIQSREQKLIDELQDQRDALEKSTERYISGLTEQLNQEKQLYKEQQNEKQLVKLRRQLAILQRSGGSATQIRTLQQQIAGKQQDQYFSEQEKQINQIKKASDLQIARMDTQIQLMTETLQFQKQNGELWKQVYQVMSSTPEQIREFITSNTPDFQSASALDVQEKIRDIDLRINEWIGYRDDENAPDMSGTYYDWNSYKAARSEIYQNNFSEQLLQAAQDEFDKVLNSTGDINAAGSAADAILGILTAKPSSEDLEKELNAVGIKDIITEAIEQADEKQKDKNKNNNNNNNYIYDGYNSYNYNRNDSNITRSTAKTNTSTDSKKTLWTFGAYQTEEQKSLMANMDRLQAQIKLAHHYGGTANNNSKVAQLEKQFNLSYAALIPQNKKKYKLFKFGGLVDYTGFAQVDGTPQRPEAFINAEQTQMLRNYLFGGSDSLLSLAQQIVQQMHGATYSSSTLHQEENSGINIQNVDVNVNVKQIANDYDVRSIGNTVMDEMLKIARKSGTRGLSRR